MQRWTDLSDSDKREIERKYRAGKTPVDLGSEFGLKPKQISDQAYRKLWDQSKKARTKSARKPVKKTKKTARKATRKGNGGRASGAGRGR